MTGIRGRIDKKMEHFGNHVIRFHWGVIVLVLILLLFTISRLPQLKFDMSTEGFFHEDDIKIIEYNSFRDEFGRDEMIFVMIKSPEMFDLSFLQKLKKLHHELEENVPYLNDINSLINARQTIGSEGQLIVQDLMEEFPTSPSAVKTIKKYVQSNPLYQNLLVSRGGEYTAIVIKADAYANDSTAESDELFDGSDEFEDETTSPKRLLSNEELSEIVYATEEIIKKYQSDDFAISVAGSPVVTDYLKKSMQGDMKRFTGMAILMVSVFLFILFRRFSGVLFPLICVLLSVIFTFGVLSLTGTAITLPIVILPSFMLAIGIGANVHFMTIFFQNYKSGHQKEAIIKAMEHTGLPIVMTSLTTAAGLASFGTAKVASIANLGQFSATGVLISLVLTLVLLPALLSTVRIKPFDVSKQKDKPAFVDNLLVSLGNTGVKSPGKTILAGSLILVFCLIGVFKLEFSHDIISWYKKDSQIRINTELIDDKLQGSVSVEVIIDTEKENGLYEPETMNAIESFSQRLINYSEPAVDMFVGKTLSLAEMLKEIHQALNENQPEYYVIPQDRNVIAQELLLFENSGSDDLETLVDSRFSKARITVKVPWNDSRSYVGFLDSVRKNSRELFGKDAKIVITGMVVLLMETMNAMMHSTVTSYLIALVVITLLMIILIGKVKMGLITMIPNISPIIMTLGLMGWLGINLDMFTLLIGSIAIGLAVDDTTHFFHNFNRYYQQSADVAKSVENTIKTAGRAMLVTSIVLTTGFWLFMFSSMNNLFNFGFLTGLTLIFAFFADVLIVPAILTLMHKSK